MMYPELKLTLHKPELVAAAALMKSTEETRYYLNGVFIQPAKDGGVHVVATDGHLLSVGYDAEGELTGVPEQDNGGGVILNLEPREFAMFAAGKCKRAEIEGEELRLYRQHKRLSEGQLAKRIFADFVDGTYPDWRRVVPETPEKAALAGFNIHYLAKYSRVAKCLGKNVRSVVVKGDSESSPHIVQFPDIDHWFGVIMPVRTLLDRGAPKWFGKPEMEKAA